MDPEGKSIWRCFETPYQRALRLAVRAELLAVRARERAREAYKRLEYERSQLKKGNR